MNSSGFHHDNAPRHELRNIQQPASGSRLRSSPALPSGLRLRCWRAALSSYVRAAAAARRERREAVMASSAASSVRPPRPKKEPQALVIPKNAAEEQKLKLERLMKNPDKAVPIPEKMSEWAPRPPPEFVRDVMGSSAGAGSGEFHVYRHLRRREYQRQDYMDAMAEKGLTELRNSQMEEGDTELHPLPAPPHVHQLGSHLNPIFWGFFFILFIYYFFFLRFYLFERERE
ncbi:PRKR-interacting protein 1 isoform X2 [Zalophus californianus]|uniref:PRKR-interacting protein 1 isoform X2 n=1 Tax=Zalophus californianus TaxID=9704 RepID=A0A6J2EFW4_ZALCA|nr:PRKR-interacting protein 1 isoform X2 [Zalophus californianus]